jgi:hypothetical protein
MAEPQTEFADQKAWLAHLARRGFTKLHVATRHVSTITEFDGLAITEFDVLPASASRLAVEGLGSGSGNWACGGAAAVAE